MPSSTKKENRLRSNILSRFLNKAKKEQTETHYDAPSFLDAGKHYNNLTIHRLTRFRFRIPAESSKDQ